MPSSHYLSLVTAGATNGHQYAAQSIAADATLCPPPSFNVPGNDMQQVTMLNSQDSHQLFFAQFARAAGEEPKRCTGDLSAPAVSQINKVEGTPDGCWRADEHSQRSYISSDQPMAEVCSSSTTAADTRFQSLGWPAHSNYQHDSLPPQARSAHFASHGMVAEAEIIERGNYKLEAMRTEEQLAKIDHAEDCNYGYPLVKTAASMPAADHHFSRGCEGRTSGRSNEGKSFAYRNVNEGHGLMSGWFSPLSSSNSSYSLPEQLGRPALQHDLQSSRSISHEQLNTEYDIRGSWTLSSSKDLQQPCTRSLGINASVYSLGDQIQNNGQQIRGAETEASYFHRQRFDSAPEADEHRLRRNGNSCVKSTAPHIHTNISLQSQIQEHIITAGRTTVGWDNRNFTDMANAANHAHTRATNIGAFEVSNDSILQHCSSAATYDAETADGVDTDTQQLLLRSSLLANIYNPIAALSKGCTQHLTDRIQAPADGRFETVANTSLDFPLPPAGNQNAFTSSLSLVMQQAQGETPDSSYMFRPSAISGNSAMTCNNAGNPGINAFFHQSTASLLPIVNAAGGLARFIQTEDPSLRRPPSDFLSLDCTYSRSGPVSVLRTSKYLKPAQLLLQEFCNVKQENSSQRDRAHINTDVAAKQQLQQSEWSAEERCHLQMRKARLISMVEELDRRYQQYQDQMQLIITSFESATGMGAAVPYTALARKLISRQFRALRDALGQHIQVACKTLGEDISNVPVLNKGETPRLRILEQRLRHHRTLQQVGMLQQHQSWRPQRGLPERSVAVLRAWLFEHFLHPYPKDSEKLMLARLSGLTRSQVANWFINARVRLWKPMVEQMYSEESKEDDSQDEGEGNVVQYGQRENKDYAWSDGGHFGDGSTMQAEDNNGAGSNHHCENSVQLSYHSGNSTMSHKELTTKHGVSLTLGLQHSSSTELPSLSYNPNYRVNSQPAPGDVSYAFV